MICFMEALVSGMYMILHWESMILKIWDGLRGCRGVPGGRLGINLARMCVSKSEGYMGPFSASS